MICFSRASTITSRKKWKPAETNSDHLDYTDHSEEFLDILNETSDTNFVARTYKYNSQSDQKKRIHNRWKWDDDKVLVLLGTLESYKNEMEYKELGFSADLVKCYSFVREGMAQLYPETDFGPKKIVGIEKENMNDEEYKRTTDKLKNMKKEGYNRIKHEIKELRSGYKTAIDKETRSDSGRLVNENFDIL